MHAYVYKVHVSTAWFLSNVVPTCPSYMTLRAFEDALGQNGYGQRCLKEHDVYFPTVEEAVCFAKTNGIDADSIERVYA